MGQAVPGAVARTARSRGCSQTCASPVLAKTLNLSIYLIRNELVESLVVQFLPVPFPVAMPPPPGIPEWVKILVTALASLAIGILLEPLRAWIQYSIAKQRTYGIVANEINALALTMSLFYTLRLKNHRTTNQLTQRPQFTTDRYDHAYEKNRDHLYQIPSWDSLSRFYGEVKKTMEAKSLTDDEVFRLLREFALLEDRIKDGILGRRMKAILIDNKFSFLTRLGREYRTLHQPPGANS